MPSVVSAATSTIVAATNDVDISSDPDFGDETSLDDFDGDDGFDYAPARSRGNVAVLIADRPITQPVTHPAAPVAVTRDASTPRPATPQISGETTGFCPGGRQSGD